MSVNCLSSLHAPAYLSTESAMAYRRYWLEVVLVQRIPELDGAALWSLNSNRFRHEELGHIAACVALGPVPVWHSKGIRGPSVAVDLISRCILSNGSNASI